MILYAAAGSCSLASQIALEEAGADYVIERLALAAGEQRSPGFLGVNPRGRVPALAIDGVAINETIAILTYVARRFSDAQLLPFDDPLLLAGAYQRMSWYASSLHVAIAQIWRTERTTPIEDGWPAIRDGGREAVERGFDEIEEGLGDDWILGSRYSVVDGYTQVFRRWGTRLEIDMSKYPKWTAHSERLLMRPAVGRALAIEAGEVGTPARAG